MLRPLLQLATRQPQLLAEHLEGYGALALAELRAAGLHWQRQGRWSLLALVAAGVALLLGGMALLLWAALPLAAMPQPWLLWALPLAPALLAAWAGWRRSALAAPQFVQLRQQWQTDQGVLQRAERP